MAPTTSDVDQPPHQQDNWGPQDEQPMGPGSGVEPPNGASLPADDDRALGQGPENPDYPRGSSAGAVSATEGKEITFREKQVKPNKVYIGGLPEHTQQEDLQSCFGKIGNIVNIELKVGYGFVEFDTREAAEESVAKYHEGYFMGNKIRVELSRGGGRTAKYTGDPGACFKCGQMGHWARECPNHTGLIAPRRPNMPQREDMAMGRPRDARYDYPPSRDYRRPPSPRDYRDYPVPPPGVRGREYDDYRRGPPMPDRERYPPPPADYRGRYPPPDANYRGYGGSLPPPPPPYYDRYERRPGGERFPPGYIPPPPGSGRPRTPPRYREDFERMPSNREFDYRGRPPSPPPPARYDEYRGVPLDQPVPGRYKRRSESPPRSYDHPYPAGTTYGNNYPSAAPGGPHPSGAPPRSGPQRDYIPPRNGLEPNPGYRRH
ncbi:RNA-binding protein lark [Termitomyces sp. T112]|nr:hypothetical protein C0989_000870 [Termitomyces sp. Mn162]KAG5728584.1 RNA-binding protein lark [Termitomyces sp. T112]KAH0590276.1 hypothetical protein H2248_000441 [Termitomyces sp. 'cryptogamus']